MRSGAGIHASVLVEHLVQDALHASDSSRIAHDHGMVAPPLKKFEGLKARGRRSVAGGT